MRALERGDIVAEEPRVFQWYLNWNHMESVWLVVLGLFCIGYWKW